MTKIRKSKNKNITLRDFRSWLEGVEQMQPTEWHPSREQWKTIRDKIDSIEEISEIESLRPIQNTQPRYQPPVRDQIPTGEISEELKRLRELESSSAEHIGINRGPTLGGMIVNKEGKTKTPDVEGVYKSTFT